MIHYFNVVWHFQELNEAEGEDRMNLSTVNILYIALFLACAYVFTVFTQERLLAIIAGEMELELDLLIIRDILIVLGCLYFFFLGVVTQIILFFKSLFGLGEEDEELRKYNRATFFLCILTFVLLFGVGYAFIDLFKE